MREKGESTMRDQDKMRTEVEIDIDSENPREIHIVVKAEFDMNGQDLYDALVDLVHNILEPEIFGDVKDCKDVRSH